MDTTKTFEDHFDIVSELGKGAFGSVSLVKHIKQGTPHAAKFEIMKKSNSSPSFTLLQYEFNLLNYIDSMYNMAHKTQKLTRFPFTPDSRSLCRSTTKKAYVMIMKQLGENLGTKFKRCRRSFTPSTKYKLFYKMLYILKELHSVDVIHRDLKPENFCLDSKDRLYIIDFGMAKKLPSPDAIHQPNKKIKNSFIFGTFVYTSINGLRGMAQDKQDDLESLGYMMVYMTHGTLPWSSSSDVKLGHSTILQAKESISLEKLCNGKNTFLYHYFDYVKSLKKNETANHDYLINLIHVAWTKHMVETSHSFKTDLLNKGDYGQFFQGELSFVEFFNLYNKNKGDAVFEQTIRSHWNSILYDWNNLAKTKRKNKNKTPTPQAHLLCDKILKPPTPTVKQEEDYVNQETVNNLLQNFKKKTIQ